MVHLRTCPRVSRCLKASKSSVRYLDSRFKLVRSIRPASCRSREMLFICKSFIGRQSIASEAKGKNVGKHEGRERWHGELQWLKSQGVE